MADDKKKPLAAAPPSRTHSEEVIFFLAGLILLAVILNQIMAYLASIGWGDFGAGWAAFLDRHFWPFWSVMKIVAVALSALCVVWLVYCQMKIREINHKEKNIYGSDPQESLIVELSEAKLKEKKNEKWERVKAHIHSENEADWRLAIIEADIMLEELLRTLGYHGDTIGDMLKAAEDSEFMNLEAAWEAHKIRNRIAHSGGDFHLAEREARRAIALFETVFREFRII